MFPGAIQSAVQRTPDDELRIFKAWLERTHGGFGCDEGPAPFRNKTVEAAYPGRRFYYVLTYTRGIPPPFANSLSLVAEVAEDGTVQPLDPGSVAGYRSGLRKVVTIKDARRAAAAVLILASGDPGERRWKYKENLITVKRNRKGCVCSYRHGDAHYTSQVRFDKDGMLSVIIGNAPPAP